MFEKPNRSWQDIAAEAYQEQDPDRRRQLTEELERCLEERSKQIRPRKVPDSENKARNLAS